MDPETIFIQAARARKLCNLIDDAGNARLVEAYMVYESAKGIRQFHFFQIKGYSKSGLQKPWKNPAVNTFRAAAIVDQSFRIRREYNPFNMKMFPIVFFSLPTVDGRYRTPDQL